MPPQTRSSTIRASASPAPPPAPSKAASSSRTPPITSPSSPPSSSSTAPRDALEPTQTSSVCPRSITKKSTRARLLLLVSLAFHLAYLPSLFDIYFTTPVVSVPTRHTVPTHTAGRLAKRVVLIVGDGLRADWLYKTYDEEPFTGKAGEFKGTVIDGEKHAWAEREGEGGEGGGRRTTPAPFMRGLIQDGKAQWGVSHTRVPTESRPGHVALIGGMYEDVSAVTRGWTTNPVPFDSVFNQSSHAYTFGSPDILPMFSLGASPPSRVSTYSYDESFEDFSKDAVHLDLWVLDKLKELFANATMEPGGELDTELRRDGTVFFEHLLGLDTTGHGYRLGAEYHRNIRVADYVARETVELFEEFYGDGETAFVFTADHGMSVLGNHGDGHPDNTRTPLVVWGKGVKLREDWEVPGEHDEYSIGWGLKGVRRDVDQADIAPLMSVLAGVPIPANSAGRLPVDYLDASPSFRAEALCANAKQLLAEAEAKSEAKKKHSQHFVPFPELTSSGGSLSSGRGCPSERRDLIQGFLDHAAAATSEGERLLALQFAEEKSLELMDTALRASAYFQKYDWLLLRSIVTTGYITFILFTIHLIVSPPSSAAKAPRSTLATAAYQLSRVVGAVPFHLAWRFYKEKAPYTYYGYLAFPFFFAYHVLADADPLLNLFRHRPSDTPSSSSSSSPAKPLLNASLIALSLALTAYGYTDRRAFALVAAGMGVVWPLLLLPNEFKKANRKAVATWCVVMAVLAVFPLLPVEKGENLWIVALGASALFFIGGVALTTFQPLSSPTSSRTRKFLIAELILTYSALAITRSSATSLRLKQGLPLLNQYAGWANLVIPSLLPLLHGRPSGQPHLERLSVLLLAFAPAFVILSLSYEALFYAVFCAAVGGWGEVEGRLARFEKERKRAAERGNGGEGKEEEEEEGKIGTKHVRISLFFLGFLHLGFFGVGNVASISSFYLEPVYRLLPVFSPFAMASLLLFKLLLPFVALASVASVLNTRHLGLPPLSLFVTGSVLSEVLTIWFFFQVTDTGSWLEIGSSITNFIICSLLGILTSLLLAGGEVAMAGCV